MSIKLVKIQTQKVEGPMRANVQKMSVYVIQYFYLNKYRTFRPQCLNLLDRKFTRGFCSVFGLCKEKFRCALCSLSSSPDADKTLMRQLFVQLESVLARRSVKIPGLLVTGTDFILVNRKNGFWGREVRSRAAVRPEYRSSRSLS